MSSFRPSAEYKRSWEELRRYGLLLLQDRTLPNLVAIVAGAPVSGSWWGHPSGRTIYAVSGQLAEHPEVLKVKLVSGKVTFVHKALWPAFLAVATSHAPWQMKGLPPASQALLRRVAREGRIDADAVPRTGLRKPAALISELERRLLVHAENVHTASGAHARSLESWEHWTTRVAWSGPTVDPQVGRTRLVESVTRMGQDTGGSGKLPWEGDPTSTRHH